MRRTIPSGTRLGSSASRCCCSAAPALAVLFMGERAERVLPKVRDWMNENSWIVNELVLLLFVGIVISSIAG